MKFLTTTIITGCVAASSFLMAQERIITSEQTPKAVIQYVSKYFPTSKIVQIKEESKIGGKEYDVKLDNLVEIDFNTKLKVTDIDNKANTALPNAVIPAKIIKYAQTHYKNNAIVSWEKSGKQQKVELDNDVELLFNNSGDFIRIDY